MDGDGKMKTEYAVEVNNEKGFVLQLDIFPTYEEAKKFTEHYPLNGEEFLNIIFINYDENGNEIEFGTVL